MCTAPLECVLNSPRDKTAHHRVGYPLSGSRPFCVSRQVQLTHPDQGDRAPRVLAQPAARAARPRRAVRPLRNSDHPHLARHADKWNDARGAPAERAIVARSAWRADPPPHALKCCEAAKRRAAKRLTQVSLIPFPAFAGGTTTDRRSPPHAISCRETSPISLCRTKQAITHEAAMTSAVSLGS